MRKIVIAGNWKMNKTSTEAHDFTEKLSKFLLDKELNEREIILFPPSLYICDVIRTRKNSNFLVGAQNISIHENGAFTGEISAEMLASLKTDFCLVGHSERRKYHFENEEVINAKIKLLLKHNIRPVVCIGETIEQREAGNTKDVIISQLTGSFKNINLSENIYIAYEPVWAIGTGKTATPQQAQEIHFLIRSWIEQNYNEEIARKIIILYGGSVKISNSVELFKQPDIDGGLIGGASLDFDDFSTIIMDSLKT